MTAALRNIAADCSLVALPDARESDCGTASRDPPRPVTSARWTWMRL